MCVCGFWLADKEWAALGGGGCFDAHDASAPAAIITTQHTTHNQTITPLSTQTLFSTLTLFLLFNHYWTINIKYIKIKLQFYILQHFKSINTKIKKQ